MLKKGSKLYSIFTLRCPRCHSAKMFYSGSWSWKKPFDMKERCSHCDLNFFPEPGYYYGSMFISYIWMGFFCLAFVMGFHWILDFSQTVTFTALSIFIAINFVYIFRISRLMWININVAYDERYAKFGLKTNEKFGLKDKN